MRAQNITAAAARAGATNLIQLNPVTTSISDAALLAERNMREVMDNPKSDSLIFASSLLGGNS
jgi:hypothetical protein